MTLYTFLWVGMCIHCMYLLPFLFPCSSCPLCDVWHAEGQCGEDCSEQLPSSLNWSPSTPNSHRCAQRHILCSWYTSKCDQCIHYIIILFYSSPLYISFMPNNECAWSVNQAVWKPLRKTVAISTCRFIVVPTFVHEVGHTLRCFNLTPCLRLVALNNLSALCSVCGLCEWLFGLTSSSPSASGSGGHCPQCFHWMGLNRNNTTSIGDL